MPVQLVDATPSELEALITGGVYDRGETERALCNAESRHVGPLEGAISIRERPAEVEDRAIPGHWEGDPLTGARNSHVATLVERHSRFVMLVKVTSKDTATVVAALSQHVRQLPATLRRSLTWDPPGWRWPSTRASPWPPM